ncbi:chromosome transmission fidelity protein 18 homolog [Zophobas morio]|uniref:chromosome transmission fidelity protein 18 homolog n=1 Tax=Zophobas morio TaxID=2755281 RepID=UPI003082CE84
MKIPTGLRLESRLRFICARERIRAEPQALAKLCKLANYDLRFCLNTLQMLKKKGKVFNSEMLSSVCFGQRDHRLSLFEIWEKIFRKERGGAPDITAVSAVQSVIENLHDHERIFLGCFENYLTVNFSDPSFSKINHVLEWVAFYDILEAQATRKSDFSLMKFLVFPCFAFHLYCSAHGRPRLNFPASFYEMNKKHDDLYSLLLQARSTLRAFVPNKTFVLELCPFLVQILNPHIRPLSCELLSLSEKNAFSRVAELLCHYNIEFVPVHMDGAFTCALQPDLEVLTSFPVGGPPRRRLTDSVKERISQQAASQKLNKTKAGFIIKEYKINTEKRGDNLKVPKEMKESLDYFGRPASNPIATSKSTTTASLHPQRVSYQYFQGFTNAVKRSVKIKDLL